jgi:glycosyltransferase involved in cell wall biosynthesis
LEEILYDARWIGNHGIGRFASEIQKQLPELVPLESQRPPFHPFDPVLLAATLWRKSPKLFFSPGYNPPLGWPGAFVFTLHDLNHLRVPENSSALKRAYYQFIIKPAAHRARCLLTVSEYAKQEIAEWAQLSEDQIVNVGNGVGPAFVPTGEKYDPGYSYLLYVGSRKAHKNLFRLLQAYSASGVRSQVRLVISGQPEQEIVDDITRLGLQRDVLFKDLLTDDELSAAYRGSVAFVFPSLYEGFGLPPAEAMACGTPVLTSNVCSLPEVVGDSALLVNPLDVEEIAEGIGRLVSDSALRAEFSKKGPAHIKRFTWDETARKVRHALTATSYTYAEYARSLAPPLTTQATKVDRTGPHRMA